MVDVSHDDEAEAEQFDTDLRVPGVAFDIGQKGFPKVLVITKLADSVTEYDEANNADDDAKNTDEYTKNVLVRTQPDDAVYQCVYLTDSPLGRTDFNDPKSRYPVPESRLFPFRHWNADPVDSSEQWDPRQFVQADVLEGLFDVAYAGADGVPTPDMLERMATDAGINSDVIQSARGAAEAHAELHRRDDMAVDDGEPDMELREVGDGDPDDAPETNQIGDDPGDPPEVPSDDGDELDDFDSFDGVE